uniref:Ubiquitin conjugation factor E4 A n=3 Tax=Cacopsylla melanoneura TaxID=428564 RepID=A0A8D8YEP2_9HEMI
MSTATDSTMNQFIECVFGITLGNNGTGLLNVKEFCSEDTQLISLEMLEQILFERLLISENIESYLIGPAPRDNHIVETQCLTYLTECFHRISETAVQSIKVDAAAVTQVKGLIIRNICTALKQPGLYESQNLSAQMIELFKNYDYGVAQLTTLFSNLVEDFIQTEDPSEVDGLLLTAFQPLLTQVTKDFQEASLLLLPLHHFDLLVCFGSIEKLAATLISFCQVKSPPRPAPPNEINPLIGTGYLYEKTLFGAMFNISCLPKHHQLHSPITMLNEFFNKPLEYTPTTLQTIEGNIWFGLDNLLNNAHKIFHTILKTKNLSVRNQLLSWIGDCLAANVKRGKLWTTVNMDVSSQLMNISDAMAFNLTAVLLKLSKPIVSSEDKYLKIDPTYCAHDNESTSSEMGIHLRGLDKETCLLPHDPESPRLKPNAPLTFITECYWMTQRSLDLSVRVMLEKLNRTNQELARLQATYFDAMNNGGALSGSPVLQHMKETLSLQTSLYLAYRTILLHPTTLSLLSQFQLCTCVYLVQLLLNTDIGHTTGPEDGKVTSFAPLVLRTVNFPLPDRITPVLKCVPEFVIENLWSFLYLIKHHKIYHLEEVGTPLLEPTLTGILAYMGTNTRIKNPHLRAKLAECLECLLPVGSEEDLNPSHLNRNILGNTARTKLFNDHPHRAHIVRSLLDIFVGIEMTGESVEFEQKFNYRRPMYATMKFLWSLDEHRAHFVRLAFVAEANMHNDQPPLFLRFINLLMNDAVFLLDEALTNMAQIRTMQSARENGEWAALPRREQEQNAGFLQHTGMMARFDNILGNETIHTLEYLTSEIRTIFCHSTMVDRIAAMLNYFLFHLVGPKKKNFKVKDMQEFKFSPATIVLNICKMYVHLGSSDEFCSAVSMDGRSYSPQLFQLAEGVLARIGGASIIPDLRRVASRVETLAALIQTDEALLSNAPDEFMDPIMNTIMIEPVILPSSKQTLDKSTIARHLLSDQSDPFNRSPLTMDQVIPNTELKEQIQAWIKQCRAAKPEPESAKPKVESAPEDAAASSKDLETSSNGAESSMSPSRTNQETDADPNNQQVSDSSRCDMES